ncbi:6080_t:CDS:1, partial [Funneliformis geosporum]
LLKCDVRQNINIILVMKKLYGKELRLEEIDIESLGFNYPICFEILDIKSKLFIEISESLYNIFKEPFIKYKLFDNRLVKS